MTSLATAWRTGYRRRQVNRDRRFAVVALRRRWTVHWALIKASHWILDTPVLLHMTPAPTTKPTGRQASLELAADGRPVSNEEGSRGISHGRGEVARMWQARLAGRRRSSVRRGLGAVSDS
jgi:hypothetical protein